MKTNLRNTIKIGLLLLTMTLSSNIALAASYTAVASGNWSSVTTWGGSAPPFKLGIADQVTIGAGITVTMDSTIVINGLLAQVSVNGTLTSAANSLILTSGTISGNGTISANSLTLNAGSTFSFSGSVTANMFTNSIASLSSSAVIMANTALNLTGILSIQTGGSLTMGSGSSINISGASLSLNGGTLGLSSAYIVNYTSASTTTGMELSGSGLKNVTINVSSGNSVALGSNVTLNDSLKLVSGSLMLNGYNLTLNSQISGSGTFMGDANANLTVNTLGGISSAFTFASGYQLLNNITVNVGSTNSIALGSALSIDGALNLAGGSNINISGVMLTLNGSLTGGGLLLVNSKSGLDIEGSASIVSAISLAGSSIGNFILNIGNGNTVTAGSDMTIDTINLESGTLVLNAHDLTINGNIATSGSGLVFATSASNVTVNASNSTTGSLSFPYPGNNVNNLTVNIGAAGSVKLGSDLIVNGSLGFISGHIDIGANNLQIASSASIIGANANAYVITGAGGYLTMHAVVSTTTSFPVGTVSYYSPASITLHTGSSTGTIGVNVSSGVYAQGTTGTLLSTSQPLVNSTWLFQTSITSGLNADMQLTWSPAIEVNGFVHTGDYISHYTAGAWDNIGDSLNATAVAGGMFSIQRTGITSMSPFAVFDKNTVTAINGVSTVAGQNGFNIYPNPVSGNLYIQNNTGVAGELYADIFNLLGERVGRFNLTNTLTAIPVNGLPSGQYIIKLYNNNGISTEKFIKL